jgi:hypothetical protein
VIAQRNLSARAKRLAGLGPWSLMLVRDADTPAGERTYSAHPSHCCPKHGCKYSQADCPVAAGAVTPTFQANNGCEICEDDTEGQVSGV